MDEISVRPAVATDRSAIGRLITSNNLNPFGLDWRNFTVAVDGEQQFVGCGQIKQHGDLQELASLAVVGNWQGRGVSRLLMDELMARGKRPLWLMCESNLTGYYTRFGFEEIKNPARLPSYFRNVDWVMRASFGLFMLARGTYVAFMVLSD